MNRRRADQTSDKPNGQKNAMSKTIYFGVGMISALLLAGCGPASTKLVSSAPSQLKPVSDSAEMSQPSPPMVDACDLILVPHEGNSKRDLEIIRLQQKIPTQKDAAPWVERLGWLFVAKARESFDPGYYKLAEQCALCLDSHKPHCPEGLLLRGHVLDSLHRFKEAEPLARELVTVRGLSSDYALLGDVLMEQGRLDEAAEAYQKMVDIKPEPEAYARVANLRWLRGDLNGAIEVMQMAAGAASPNAPESAAWFNTRLAFFKFQQGDIAAASETCEAALGYQQDYAPALLLQGKLMLSNGKDTEAVDLLQRAVALNPLPDYQWVLSEALRAAGQNDEAEKVEQQLTRKGAASDPRTFALYLATKGSDPATALDLAQAELNNRSDVFSHDAMAWALAANGRSQEAWQEMQAALAEGTKDARLYFHAALLAVQAGQAETAQPWISKATSMMHQLLPSEQKQLLQTLENLGQVDREDTSSASDPKNSFISGNQ